MKSKLLIGLASAALLLAGCTTPTVTKPSESSSSDGVPLTARTPDSSAVPEGLETFYSQQITWEDCGTDLRCTDVTVPMDYANPDGETITIRVKQLVSAGADAPALLLNPGGPGGSGVQMMDYVNHLATKKLREHYNLTGFDPRGVNESSAVSCLSDAERDAYRAEDADLSSEAGREAAAAATRAYGEKCAEKTGKLLGFVDTVSAARDMDILRAVISGAPTLDYLGFSYGTYLGGTYADLFPKNVGRFVLDGALDPATTSFDVSLGQAEGFDKSIRAYIADCQAGSNCPLKGSVDDGIEQLKRFFDSLRTNPLPTGDGDRMLTRPLGITGVITPLYSQQSWPQLTMGLTQAMTQQDGSMLLMMADMMSDRNADGTYATNSDEAFTAINCLDYPVRGTKEEWAEEAKTIEQASPLFGQDLGYGDLQCENWPVKSTRERTELKASGSNPILVVGTTGDPATPYKWSEALAKQLENGHLLTYEGEGHTAYNAKNTCIANHVDDFLIDGTVPSDGTRCS